MELKENGRGQNSKQISIGLLGLVYLYPLRSESAWKAVKQLRCTIETIVHAKECMEKVYLANSA